MLHLSHLNFRVPPLSDEAAIRICYVCLRFIRQYLNVNLLRSRIGDLPVRLTQHYQI